MVTMPNTRTYSGLRADDLQAARENLERVINNMARLVSHISRTSGKARFKNISVFNARRLAPKHLPDEYNLETIEWLVLSTDTEKLYVTSIDWKVYGKTGVWHPSEPEAFNPDLYTVDGLTAIAEELVMIADFITTRP